MKKLFISLFVVAAVSFSACGGSVKTEEAKVEEPKTEAAAPAAKSIVQQYGELLTKNAEIAKKVQGGDVSAASDILKLQEEMTKFLEDNKDAIANFTAEEQAELVKIQEKIAADLAPALTK